MKISILTLFPEMFISVFKQSILKRAQDKKIASIEIINIRDFAFDKHHSVDDKPYGGGVGMVMRIDVLENALKSILSDFPRKKTRIILLDPKGTLFCQKTARRLKKYDHLILICGHYEGVDARIKNFIDESVSVGNFILTGGELAAMMVTDSIIRLLPGVLKKEATNLESIPPQVLEHPQYTRPPVFKNLKVPGVLLSGDHGKIKEWKEKHTRVRKAEDRF